MSGSVGLEQEGLVIMREVEAASDRGAALVALAQDADRMRKVALWYQTDEIAYQCALTKLQVGKGSRIGAKEAATFQRLVDELTSGVNRGSSSSPSALASFVQHPLGDELMVPANYLMDSGGTYVLRVSRNGGALVRERVCHYPLVLEGYVRDAESGLSQVVVAWLANGKWRRMVLSRERMAVGADFARAASPFGAPVQGANANAVILYLAAFEAQNIARFEEVRGVSRMGWLPDMDAFLVGTQLVTEKDVQAIESPLDLKDGWRSNDYVFVPSGPEVTRMMAGYRQAGTLEGWSEAAKLASEYPLALAGIYVALLPPLLQIIGADNFVWEWSGKSSVGKTTALSLAASVWGQPRLNLDPSIVSSWRVTDVYIERMLACLGDLPLFLDDTRTASTRMKNGIDPVQVVYDVVSGTTKGRGTITGTEFRRGWRTVMLSTGEDPITGDTTKLGVFARTWAIFGQPWGRTCPETAQLVLNLESILNEHYGTVGPAWVQRIQSKRASWPKWKDVYRDLRDSYGTRGAVGENAGISGRLGKNIASIELCASLAHALMPEVFNWNFRPMIEDLWKWAQSDGCGMDPSLEAIQAIRNWAFANVEKFYPRGQAEPPGGWLGIWPMPSKESLVPPIHVRPDLLMAQIKAMGHANPNVVLDEWSRRGWMGLGSKTNAKGRMSIFAKRAFRYGNVEMFAYELNPPVEGEETMTAYEDLAQKVAESMA